MFMMSAQRVKCLDNAVQIRQILVVDIKLPSLDQVDGFLL